MNKLSKNLFMPKVYQGSPLQEILKIAVLVTATCLAYKLEDVIRELMSNNARDVLGNVRYMEEE